MPRLQVKQVLSGDCIVVWGKPLNGPPQEQILTISNITAPRMGKKDVPDQEWAYASRELLRNKIVGKAVDFTVLNSVNGRDYCSVVHEEKNLAEFMVENGLAKLRENVKDEKLVELQAEAQKKQIGLWSSEAEPVMINHNCSDDDIGTLAKRMKGKTIPAIVEYVRDCCTFRILLCEERVVVPVILSGVKGPHGPNDPFFEESKYFVESRLLQRAINLCVEGIYNSSIVGSIVHPAGNITEILLKEGFVTVADWSLPMNSFGSEKLREAEKFAKEKRVRLWKSYVPKAIQPKKENEGTVIRILNGETIIVDCNGVEKKVTFSSLRQPKVLKPDGKMDSNVEIGWNFDAREYLRKKLIGQKVKICLDYIKPANEGFEEKYCCSIFLNEKNVGEMLLSKGLAHLIRHKKEDNDRSSCYESLVLAEDKAIKAKKGIFSEKEPTHRFVDVSETVAKATSFLQFFKRQKRLDCVVEYISNCSRYRLLIPSENCKLTFILAGVSCPRMGREGEKSEPFAEESLKEARNLLMQRNVQIEVESIDKQGGFLGTLFFHQNGQEVNAACHFLSKGFASMFSLSGAYGNEMQLCEEEAQKAKRGIWSLQKEVTNSKAVKTLGNERIQLAITEVVNGSKFYAQKITQDITKLEELMASLNVDSASAHLKIPVQIGDLVRAKSSIDGGWYRGKIVKSHRGTNFDVYFLDFGNTENVPVANLTGLKDSFVPLKPQAIECKLSLLVSNAVDDEIGVLALQRLQFLASAGDMVGRIDFMENNVHNITLFDPKKPNPSVNSILLEEGLCRLESKIDEAYEPLLQDLKASQEKARKMRINLWRYGDFIDEDDAPEFGFAKRTNK